MDYRTDSGHHSAGKHDCLFAVCAVVGVSCAADGVPVSFRSIVVGLTNGSDEWHWPGGGPKNGRGRAQCCVLLYIPTKFKPGIKWPGQRPGGEKRSYLLRLPRGVSVMVPVEAGVCEALSRVLTLRFSCSISALV